MSAVRAGYKQTEVGVIPVDWGVKPLGEIGNVLMCKRVLKHQTREHGDVPFYKIGTFGGVADAYIPQSLLDEFQRKYSFPKKGDVLISAAGTIGRTVIYDGAPAYFQDSNIVWIDNDESTATNAYLWHRYQVTKWSVSHGGTVARLYNDNLRTKIFIPVPALPEQEAIAEALSDADALIESLEQLLAKKRHLKQGAMQELLTGKKRLPGFRGEWERQTLESIIDGLEAGVSVNSLDSQPRAGEPSILKTSAMVAGRFLPFECKVIAPVDASRARANPRKDTILISRMNTPDLVGEVGYVDDEYPWLFLPDRIWMTRFRAGSEICVRWLAYLLSSVEYKRLIQGAATGTSGSMKNISKPGLLSLSILFPPYSEQSAIATILSDMDAEIAVLESQLAKTRAIKQGMMQKLLTGEIRLL